MLSPVRPGLFVTVALKKRELPGSLTPAIGASGPHDFTVRISRARQSQPSRPPPPAPNVRDDSRSAPLMGHGMDLGRMKTEIFLQRGLDRESVICPSGSFDALATVAAVILRACEAISAVILRSARACERVSKDGREHWAEHHPSRRGEDAAPHRV